MQELTTYAPALPEIAIAVGALLLLMLGALRPAAPAGDYLTGALAIVVLVIASALVLAAPDQRVVLFDGAFIVDGFGRFMKLLVLGGSILVLVMSMGDLARAKLLSSEYSVLLLLSVLGMMLMISAGSLISLYLGLELQSLALYVVAAIDRSQVRSSEAGLKYFVLGSLSSGMLLYGASLIYGFTGSTDFAAIAAFAQGQPAGRASVSPSGSCSCSSGSRSRSRRCPSICGRPTSTRVHPRP